MGRSLRRRPASTLPPPSPTTAIRSPRFTSDRTAVRDSRSSTDHHADLAGQWDGLCGAGQHQRCRRRRRQRPFDHPGSLPIGLPSGIADPPPTITLTSPANGTVSAAPASINVAAAVADNGHSITQVQFYNGARLLGVVGSEPYTFAWNNVSAGTYSLSALAVYDTGSTVSSAAANVKVAARRLRSEEHTSE